MAGKLGLEPRFHDPESCVLPIGRLPSVCLNIANFQPFFKTLPQRRKILTLMDENINRKKSNNEKKAAELFDIVFNHGGFPLVFFLERPLD